MSKHCRYAFLVVCVFVVVCVSSVLYLYYPRELRLRIVIDRTDPSDAGAIFDPSSAPAATSGVVEKTTQAPTSQTASRKPTDPTDHDGRRSDATSPTLADSLPSAAQSHATAADKSQTDSPSQSEATTLAVTTQQDSTEGFDSTTESIHASTLTRLGSDLSIDLSSCPSGSIMLQPDWRKRKPLHNNCPTLFIVGVRKGGTTSLYHYMDKHPNFKCLRMSNGPMDGETFYFSRGYGGNWEKYVAKFPRGVVSGESSVDNIVSCKVPERLFESCGMQAKVVMLLRHPIDRLMSNFLMRARLGTYSWHPTSMKTKITDEVNSELGRFSKRIAPMIHSNVENFTISPNDWAKILCVFNPATNLVNEGMYYAFVQNYLCNFPAENILFVSSEEFFTNSSRVLNQIFKFLGLEELDEKTLKGITSEVFNRRNQEILPHQVLSAADREKLNRIYQPFNAALFNLLGWDNVKWD